MWDYPRPPRIELDKRLVTVGYAGATIAETNRAYRVLETASPPTFYLPPGDVQLEQLVRVSGSSHCEWKGEATYLSLSADPSLGAVAWTYRRPYAEFEALRDCVSFYPSKLECSVGGERVAPQPGGFYGGWVTPEIVGPFKGEPGTADW